MKKIRKSKIKCNYLVCNFRAALAGLKELKNYFIFSLIILLLFNILGLVYPYFFEDEILRLINLLVSETENLSTLGLISFITLNNIQVGFFSIIFGIFLGILPLIVLVVNGYVLGFVLNYAISDMGILAVLKLLPHGVFEIPAILISTSLGLKLGIDLKNVRKNFVDFMRIFVFIIIPLLVVAGVIEGILINVLV